MLYMWARMGIFEIHLELPSGHVCNPVLRYERALTFAEFASLLIPMTTSPRRFVVASRIAAT